MFIQKNKSYTSLSSYTHIRHSDPKNKLIYLKIMGHIMQLIWPIYYSSAIK